MAPLTVTRGNNRVQVDDWAKVTDKLAGMVTGASRGRLAAGARLANLRPVLPDVLGTPVESYLASDRERPCDKEQKMKRLIATTALVTLTYLAVATAHVWAYPPSSDNLPEGTAVLPGPNHIMMLVPRSQVRPYEKPHPGPLSLYSLSWGGDKAKVTPIPLPGPRSVGAWYGTSNRISKPNTLPRPPRPMVTPIPLP